MNVKRQRKNKTVQLGTYVYTERDILNIEKILKKHLGVKQLVVQVGKEKWIGMIPYSIIEVGGINKAPKHAVNTRYLRIIAKPTLRLVITPLRTTLTAQRIYSKGDQLAKIDKAALEVSKYVRQRQRRLLFNKVRLAAAPDKTPA